jgi:hypothetical protein
MSCGRSIHSWRVCAFVAVAAAVPAQADLPARAVLESTHALPAVLLPGGHDVALGGLSDLCVTVRDAAGITLWTLTDRGPNGTVGSGDDERRTLLAPDFSPVLLRLRMPARAAAEDIVNVEAMLPLTAASGAAVTGRPNGIGRDEAILDAAGRDEVSSDPNGVDTEGLVVMPDGSFWASEEYRPSLLRIDPQGRCFERHVPEGASLAGSGMKVVADIPAVYGDRRDNRGFEGLTLSADGKRLFVLLQSPLDYPVKKSAKQTGNVRLLVADAATGTPVAEHVYRLGHPGDDNWAERGAPPEDGKLCALAALRDGSLLVLEQADGGLVRLYRADLQGATDTLPRTRASRGEPLEPIGDLAAAGIEPLRKSLVADLGPLVPRLREDVFGSAAEAGSKLKLEGLAVLDDHRVLLVNDDDFGVHARSAATKPRSCLWVVRLPAPLPAHESLTTRR